MLKKINDNRFKSLIVRTIKDVEIYFASFIFGIRYSKNNKFRDLFFFRKAIEVDQISPFRIFFTKPQKRKPAPLLLPQFGNVNVSFDLNDSFQMAICEEFVKYKIYNLRLVDFVPDISIDCGSYRGYFTFLINQEFANCKKICVEPHPGNYKNITKTVEENKIRNIETINKALSKSPDKVVLELWGSNMSLSNARDERLNLVQVDAISLFKLLEKVDQKNKLVLKVDIEGSELDFFPECIAMLPNCTAVYLETHDGWNSLHGIQSRFEECGFRFSILRERSLYIDSFAIRS